MKLSDYRRLIEYYYKKGIDEKDSLTQTMSPAEYFAYVLISKIQTEVSSRLAVVEEFQCRLSEEHPENDEHYESSIKTEALIDELTEIDEFITILLGGEELMDYLDNVSSPERSYELTIEPD